MQELDEQLTFCIILCQWHSSNFE